MQEDQLSQKKKEGWISMGSSILGALFSRKVTSTGNVGRASSAARSAGRTAKEKSDVERAKRDLVAQREKLVELEETVATAISELQEKYSGNDLIVEEQIIRPRKGDLEVTKPQLIWTPWKVSAAGIAEPAFDA